MGIDGMAIPYVLLILLSICELSDFFDGFFARRHNKVTDLGKVLDPMADSIFRLSVFFTLTQGVVQLPLLLVFIFFFRDSIISTLRTLCALRGVTLAARMTGKIKAIVQAATAYFILILMIPYSKGCLDIVSFQQMSFYAASIAALYTLISGIEYIYANWAYIKKAIEKI
jgi:CDP-diacylglycerol--glycerol-3-phosphate 3-phosphatidyltransferase